MQMIWTEPELQTEHQTKAEITDKTIHVYLDMGLVTRYPSEKTFNITLFLLIHDTKSLNEMCFKLTVQPVVQY